MRRHPSHRALGAWFDGEDTIDTVDPRDHIAGCDRCRRRLHELRRVRAGVRGEAVPPALLRRRPTWVPVAAPVAFALVVALLLAASPATVQAPLRAARGLFDPPTDSGRGSAHPPTSVVPRQPGAGPRTGSATGSRPAQGRTAPTTAPVASAALRLAVVVPTTGPDAGVGADVVAAVQRVVDGANRTGGVGGRAVELVVASAGDSAAVASLRGRADVAVGGFGAAPSLPWVLPADAAGSGALVTAEETPVEAGARLGADLARRGVQGDVGVVVGPGPDAALADGLARAVPVTTVAAAGDDCNGAVRDLRARLVATLAVAGPPDLARRCLDAAARLGWRPPGGVMIAPSAAYADVHLAPYAVGARTVLGVPWPSSEEPGAARFRAAMGGTASYRAIVSFAAAEIAVAAARSGGPFRPEILRSGSWRTDLVVLDAGVNRAAAVVIAGADGWRTTSPRFFANN